HAGPLAQTVFPAGRRSLVRHTSKSDHRRLGMSRQTGPIGGPPELSYQGREESGQGLTLTGLGAPLHARRSCPPPRAPPPPAPAPAASLAGGGSKGGSPLGSRAGGGGRGCGRLPPADEGGESSVG